MTVEKNDVVQGLKYDLEATQEKLVSEKVNPLLEEVKSLREKIAANAASEEDKEKETQELKSRLESMEAMMARPAAGSDEDEAKEQKQAMDSFIRKGIVDGVKVGSDEIAIKAMSTQDDPKGGYLVHAEFGGMVNGRIFETSPLRQVANVIQGSNESIEFDLDDDEAAARWVAQGASGGETDTPDTGKVVIFAHKIEADPRVTTELLQDAAYDVEGWLQTKVANKFSRLENTAFISGTGVGEPTGILSYAAWATAGTYERDKIEQINSGATAALTADGLIDLQNSLKEEYQANAVFLMKRSTFGAIKQLKSTDTYHFTGFQPDDREGSTMVPTLLGKRVIFCDDMPAVAANALSIAYGDFSRAYAIYDRVGLTVLRDPYTNKGYVTYYTTKRTGGGVINFDAIKLQKVAS